MALGRHRQLGRLCLLGFGDLDCADQVQRANNIHELPMELGRSLLNRLGSVLDLLPNQIRSFLFRADPRRSPCEKPFAKLDDRNMQRHNQKIKKCSEHVGFNHRPASSVLLAKLGLFLTANQRVPADHLRDQVLHFRRDHRYVWILKRFLFAGSKPGILHTRINRQRALIRFPKRVVLVLV